MLSLRNILPPEDAPFSGYSSSYCLYQICVDGSPPFNVEHVLCSFSNDPFSEGPSRSLLRTPFQFFHVHTLILLSSFSRTLIHILLLVKGSKSSEKWFGSANLLFSSGFFEVHRTFSFSLAIEELQCVLHTECLWLEPRCSSIQNGLPAVRFCASQQFILLPPLKLHCLHLPPSLPIAASQLQSLFDLFAARRS